MKKLLVAVSLVLLASGCSAFCYIPEEVRESEEIQYSQAVRVNSYLHHVVENPQLLTNPQYQELKELVLLSSESLVRSIKNQSDYLGHTEEFLREQEEKEANRKKIFEGVGKSKEELDK